MVPPSLARHRAPAVVSLGLLAALSGCRRTVPAAEGAWVSLDTAVSPLPVDEITLVVEPGRHRVVVAPGKPQRLTFTTPATTYEVKPEGAFLARHASLTVDASGRGHVAVAAMPLSLEAMNDAKIGTARAKTMVVDARQLDRVAFRWVDATSLRESGAVDGRSADLPDRVLEQWQREGAHRDASDTEPDLAVIAVSGLMGFDDTARIVQAVLAPTREVMRAGHTERMPVFAARVALTSRYSIDDTPDSEAAEQAVPPPTPDVLALAKAGAVVSNRLGFDVFARLAKQPGNVVICPISAAALLAMMGTAASGATAAEIAARLGASSDREARDRAKALADALAARTSGESGQIGHRRFELRIANALWPRKGEPMRDGFVSAMNDGFGAPPVPLDFAASPVDAANLINGWSAKATAGRIARVVGPDDLRPSTRVVLANAVYFDAGWQTTFPVQATKPAPFHPEAGPVRDVPMMQTTGRFEYVKTKGFTALRLPYSVDALGMLLVLPDQRASASVEARLPEVLDEAARGLQATRVRLSVPRFRMTMTRPLLPILQDLGVRRAFSETDADFSSMTTAPGTHVSQVLQTVDVEVNETGTIAAATSISLGTGLGKFADPLDLTFDRPFYFAIHDTLTGALLFVGRVASLP